MDSWREETFSQSLSTDLQALAVTPGLQHREKAIAVAVMLIHFRPSVLARLSVGDQPLQKNTPVRLKAPACVGLCYPVQGSSQPR